LRPTIGQPLALVEQADAAARAVHGAGRRREAAGERVRQADGAVELAEEGLGGGGELAEGAAEGERGLVERGAKPLGGAQQRREDALSGEPALGAELAQLADGDAELARQALGEQRHGFEDGAQLVALQHAGGERLGKLKGGAADLLGGGAGDDGNALQAADQADHLVRGGADLAGGDAEALEGVDALGDGDAGGERVAVERLVDLAGALDRAGGGLQPEQALRQRIAGLHEGAGGHRDAGDLHAADRQVHQRQRAGGGVGAVADAFEAALAGLADLAQPGLHAGSIVQRQADRDAAGAIRHG
jgi:hypothetical protein